jgi:hypothetical protein
MIKNVLVNGCSFSRGPESWPYYLQKNLNCNLVNLSQAGAGNLYIHNSTISELSRRSYDLVIIMWSGLERVDMQVEDISLFDQTVCTSYSQSKLNDWPEKNVYPINDQDYVEKNWVFSCNGHDAYLKSIKFADTNYRYVGRDQAIQQSLMHMISLQSILKQMKIPYLFTFYNDYITEIKNNFLFQQLDSDNMYTDQNINVMAKRNNSFSQVDHPDIPANARHPGGKIHKMWADLIEIKLHEHNSK